MERQRVETALARIEAATARIEAVTARAPVAGDGELALKHDRLRASVATTLTELDRLIGSLEA